VGTPASDDWRAQLAERIRGLKADDWDQAVLSDSQGIVRFRVQFKELCVTFGATTPELAERLLGKVNLAAVEGIPAGHLLIKACSWRRPAGPGTLVLILNQQPWNITYNPANGTLVDFRDASGQLVYEATDFGALR
jgi:hypothetical protein